MSKLKLPHVLTVLTAEQIAAAGYSTQTLHNYRHIAKKLGNVEIYLKLVESQLINKMAVKDE